MAYDKVWKLMMVGIFLTGTLILGTTAVHAQKFQVSLFGGFNHVFQYGSEEDYAIGENDFPVTPAHNPLGLGGSFGYFLTKRIAVEFDGRYTFSSSVTLIDPSDQDSVDVDTSKHYSLTLNVIYHFMKGMFRPYVIAGGGIDKLLAEDKTYTSAYGYEIEMIAPSSNETWDPLANVGAGIQYLIGPQIGIRLDVRYIMIFDSPSNIHHFNAVLGIVYKF